jgi:hypothetical protein
MATRQTGRVYGAISIARVIFDHLQDACTAKSAQRLDIGVLSATLHYVECIANRVLHIFWKGSEVGPGASNSNDSLDAGQSSHFHIMLKQA